MRTKLEVLQDTLETLTDLYLVAYDGDEVTAVLNTAIDKLGKEIQDEHANN